MEKIRTLTDAQHTSMNLGLITLSGDVELKIKAICLQANCPYIFEPESTFRSFCNTVVLIAIVIQSVLLPYMISINRKITDVLKPIMFLFDCIYLFDIYLQLSTAIKGRVHTITTTSAIIIYKLKEISFLIDLMAILPFNYIAIGFGASDHVTALLEINRLLKVHRLIDFMKVKEKDLTKNYLKMQLIKYIIIYLFLSKYILVNNLYIDGLNCMQRDLKVFIVYFRAHSFL